MSRIDNLKQLALPGDYRVIKGRVGKETSKRAVFIDIDGTLWPDSGPGTILKNPRISSEIISELGNISNLGYLVIGFSNQTFFGYQDKLNLFTIRNYRNKVRRLTKKAIFDAIYICHHHPDSSISYLKSECSKRKPNSGLVMWAKEELNLDLDKSVVIGDRITDIAAGQDSGIAKRFLIVNPRSLEWNISRRAASLRSLSFRISRSLIEALESMKSEIS